MTAFERRCAACRRRDDKRALRRFVVAGDRIVADLTQRAHGRGAYLCDTCEPAASLANLRRALRAPATVLDPTPIANG